jgi:hypothetical protein
MIERMAGSVIVLASTTEWIGAVAAALGIPVAAVALVVAARQLTGQRRATEAQFLLSLDDAFRSHDATHRKFRPAPVEKRESVGLWHGETAAGPETAEEWADVEAYMGLFERVNVMIEGGLIDADTFEHLYGYRVGNVLSNPRVVTEKLVKRGEGWVDFIALARRLGYDVPDAPRSSNTAARGTRPAG